MERSNGLPQKRAWSTGRQTPGPLPSALCPGHCFRTTGPSSQPPCTQAPEDMRLLTETTRTWKTYGLRGGEKPIL